MKKYGKRWSEGGIGASAEWLRINVIADLILRQPVACCLRCVSVEQLDYITGSLW